MDDDLHKQIDGLVAEEHTLRQRHGDGSGLDESERDRLRRIEEDLDRMWDLLRQRDARRAAGQDPGLAKERSAQTVEGYWN